MKEVEETLSEVSGQVVAFVKAHACGNDFLIVEDGDARGRHGELARRLCARTTGIGADGVEFLSRQDGYRLRLFNSDGSEAELSGNGTRCVAAWLAESEGIEQALFDTHGGPRSCRVIERERGRFVIEGGMGRPRVMPRTIVVEGLGEIPGAMVNVGNPHFVVFVETGDFGVGGRSWKEAGRMIGENPLFTHGTNVEFVRQISSDEIEFRIFERGCGPTTSSGTGTCASAAASMVMRSAGRDLRAIAEGGAQRVVWLGNDGEMLLTGPAEIVCVGKAWSS